MAPNYLESIMHLVSENMRDRFLLCYYTPGLAVVVLVKNNTHNKNGGLSDDRTKVAIGNKLAMGH